MILKYPVFLKVAITKPKAHNCGKISSIKFSILGNLS
jgi:hypothetical protein